MRSHPYITIAAVWAFCCAASVQRTDAQELAIKSPDGKLALFFGLKALPAPYASGERPYYRASFEDRDLLADSPLGLEFDGAAALNGGLGVAGSSTDSHDSSWEDTINDNRAVRDHYNQLTVHLQEPGQGTSAG